MARWGQKRAARWNWWTRRRAVSASAPHCAPGTWYGPSTSRKDTRLAWKLPSAGPGLGATATASHARPATPTISPVKQKESGYGDRYPKNESGAAKFLTAVRRSAAYNPRYTVVSPN